MNKIAQRRKWYNKLREEMGTPAEAVTRMFSPEFSRLMDRLREVDDEAREHAVDLKDILKTAKSNFNRREYMTAITFLGRFHEKTESIKKEFLKLIEETDLIHNEFLFKDLDPEHKKYLSETMSDRYKSKPKAPTAPAKGKADDGLSKEADVKDWWHNLTSDRGKALKNWEKRFPKRAKEIKRQTEKMLNRSEMFMNFTLSTFKTLTGMRSTRSLEEYLKTAQNFIQKYDAYDAAFAEYFNTNVRSFVESQKKFDASKEQPQEPEGTAGGEATPDSESGVETNRIPPSGGGGGGGKEKTIDEVLQDMEQGKSPSEPTPDDAVLRQLMNGPNGRTEQERLEILRDPLGEDPSSAPRDFPKPDLYTPDTTGSPAPDPNSFLGMLPGAPSAPAISSGPESVTAPPTSGDRAMVPAGTPPMPLDSTVQELTTSPTMRSPVMPPPESPLPSANIYEQPIPAPPKVPIIDETPHSSNKYYMYPQPPVAPPPNTTKTMPAAPMAKEQPMSAPATEQRPRAHQPTLVYKPLSRAEEFMDKLTKLSGENPLVMASEIIKFAKSIEQTDATTSKKLLVVAKSLLR